MAKSTSDKTKTTKTDAAKGTAEKKTAAAKKATDAKATTEKAAPKAAPKKAGSTSKATKAGTDSGAALVKRCQEAVDKFDKLGDAKYSDIKEKLQWCIGSYNHDKNPSGLKEYGRKAADMLKEARAEKPKQVSQKLIDDLEKAVEKV